MQYPARSGNGVPLKTSILLITALFLAAACAPRSPHPRIVPAPYGASDRLKSAINAGFPEWRDSSPKNIQEWKSFRRARAQDALKNLPALREALGVKSARGELGGVPVYTVEPDVIPKKNKDKILLCLHGGGYVLGPGEAGLGEALLMAGIGKFKVVSVDYRLAPEFPWPAALDDSLKVYKALLKSSPASHIGVFGTSAGGGLALALVLKAKQEGLPLPGAIAPGTPWSDLTKSGDSYLLNEKIDNVLVSYDGWLKAAAKAYAGGRDFKDPLISPVYGDVSGFPPALLASGTRDLFLSNTVRMHRRLLEAGVPADLLVIEGLSHAQYMMLGPDAPETLFYYGQLARFFDKSLK